MGTRTGVSVTGLPARPWPRPRPVDGASDGTGRGCGPPIRRGRVSIHTRRRLPARGFERNVHEVSTDTGNRSPGTGRDTVQSPGQAPVAG